MSYTFLKKLPLQQEWIKSVYVAIADGVGRVSERTRHNHRLDKQILISVSNVMQDQATGGLGLPISKT